MWLAEGGRVIATTQSTVALSCQISGDRIKRARHHGEIQSLVNLTAVPTLICLTNRSHGSHWVEILSLSQEPMAPIDRAFMEAL